MREAFIIAGILIAWLYFFEPSQPPQDMIDFLEGDHSLVEAVPEPRPKHRRAESVTPNIPTWSVTSDMGTYHWAEERP